MSRAVRHSIVRWNILIFAIFCGLWSKCTLTELLCQQLFLDILFLLPSFRVIRQFFDCCRVPSYTFGHLIDFRFVSILSIDLFFNKFPHYLLPLVISFIQTLNPIFIVLCSSVGVTFNNDLRGGIDFGLKGIALFISPLFACFFFLFILSLYKSLLTLIEIFHVTIEHIGLGWHEIWRLGNMRMERIVFVDLVIYRHIMVHLFLNSIVCIAIETIDDWILIFLVLFNNCNFLWLFIHLWLESKLFLLFLLILNSKLLQFLIFLFLQLPHSIMNRIPISKLVQIYDRHGGIRVRMMRR